MIPGAAALVLALSLAAPALAQEAAPDAALVFRAAPDEMIVPPGSVQASAGADQFGQPVVTMTLDAPQAARFGTLTGNHINEVVVVWICQELATAPRVMERISGGKVMISGSFTEAEAADLARRITDSDCFGFSSPFNS